MNSHAISEIIQEKREQKGILWHELGAPFLSKSQVAMIESGESEPEPKVYIFLLERLGFSAK